MSSYPLFLALFAYSSANIEPITKFISVHEKLVYTNIIYLNQNITDRTQPFLPEDINTELNDSHK